MGLRDARAAVHPAVVGADGAALRTVRHHEPVVFSGLWFGEVHGAHESMDQVAGPAGRQILSFRVPVVTSVRE